MSEAAFHFSPRRYAWSLCEAPGGRAWAMGYAFAGGGLMRAEALARFVADGLAAGQGFAGLLAGLNGHFALAAEAGGRAFFAVDPVRSFPLYFRADGPALLVSDEYRELRRDGDALDRDALLELATAGLVCGQGTLHAGIRALQAGELGVFGAEGASFERYYDYRCAYDLDQDEDALCAELDRITVASMERALAFCGKRQLVLPLSGGLDSRLIAGTLKRLGRNDVFCFAYGLPGNRELAKSREVAEALGYSWTHVAYDLEGIRRTLFSGEAQRYKSMAHGGVSLPFIDDWAALWTLRERGLVDADAVFLPGQSGDFTCGSHLKYLLDPEWRDDPADVAGAIIAKHFSNWEDLPQRPELRQRILARLAAQAEGFDLESETGRAAFYEYWECQERQVKYVVNGGRGYEFFGYSWAYPLWDRELMDFWKRPSVSLKMDSYLYRKYLADYDPFGLFAADRRRERWTREWALGRLAGRRVSRVRRLERALAPVPLLGGLARAWRRHKEHTHFLRHNALGYPRGYGGFRYAWTELAKRHHLSLMFRDFFREEYGLDLLKALDG